MSIQISSVLENTLLSLVQSGQFASVDDAMAEAARLLVRQHPTITKPMTEAAFHQHLLDIGLLSSLPDTESDYDDPDDQLITIEGEPISETVIRERR